MLVIESHNSVELPETIKFGEELVGSLNISRFPFELGLKTVEPLDFFQSHFRINRGHAAHQTQRLLN